MNDFDYPDCFAEIWSRYMRKGSGSGLPDLPPDKRPRERLLANGPASLSDAELLAVILNTGTQGKNVSILAGEVLGLLDRNKNIPRIEELSRLTGMGKTKASQVAAMLEFGRRRWGSVGTRVKQPLDIFTLVRHNADRKQERFISISLNGAHEALAVRVVTIGLLNRTIVHPREVFADLIQDRAAAFAVAHNHPSGKILPSSEDDEITERLRAAADILGLHFLDHLIFSENDWWSYRQNGRIGENSREGEQRAVLPASATGPD
ncbi:MAG: DNA repair protein RadC [Treponema sp.]|jgi:DNA repair protein RadC|nr:DNA repair protein RadC [Treponema sp.]